MCSSNFKSANFASVQIMCCKIPSPVQQCENVKERLVFASACDNSRGTVSRLCMHNVAIGISYVYDEAKEAEAYFYSSNGFTPNCIADELKAKLTSQTPEACGEEGCGFDWANAPKQVWQEAVSVPHSNEVEPHQRYRIYQVNKINILLK